jgi:6-pyruvoyltetrahydropterin/6-carboxytetrahydropterin synthase
MVRLTREVRFLVDPTQQCPLETPRLNTWAGWPSSVVLAPYLTLRVTVLGTQDRQTGYLCDIHLLDRILHTCVIPDAYELSAVSRSTFTGDHLLWRVYPKVSAKLPQNVRLAELELLATPQLRFSISSANPEASPLLAVTQQFEFAAAHRLHCDDLSDEENKALFGKCNNPSGHGHNYLLEVTVQAKPEGKTGIVLPISSLDQIVKRVVLDRFDHKNLNVDIAEFRVLNPSVENIAQVIFDLLKNEFAPYQLAAIRVHESPRTSAEVRRKPAP